MFLIIYYRLCFQHRLIQYLVIQLFRFYNEEKVGMYACLRCSAKGDDENTLDQMLEVLTPAQGYLMFFDNSSRLSDVL
jgi:hypothetical protein